MAGDIALVIILTVGGIALIGWGLAGIFPGKNPFR